MFEVTESPIIPERILSQVKRDASGAIVTFMGSARPYSSDGRAVLFVEFEVNRQTAEQQLREVEKEICTKWQLEDVALCHRLGRVGVGETILVVAIAAPHRLEAFEACQYAVDRIKQNIPLRETLKSQ